MEMEPIEEGSDGYGISGLVLDTRFLNSRFFAASLLHTCEVNCAMQGATHRASALAGSPPSSWLGDAGKVGPGGSGLPNLERASLPPP